jgi:NADPH:quinone reductase-like Zn-dependent oxidoreductase
VLVQGATGGVSTAAIALASATGCHVTATSRSETAREAARGIGAADALPSGMPLANLVDLVIETVGEATWEHSLKSLKPGGTIVVAGATSGRKPPTDLNRVFFLQLSIVGSTMGTRDELDGLVRLLADSGVRPLISDVRPLAQIRDSMALLAGGDVFGKLVLTT